MTAARQQAAVGGGVGGAAGIVVVWLISLAGVEVPAEVAVAIGALLTAAIGWFRPRDAAT